MDDSEPLKFTNWNQGEPNNWHRIEECAEMSIMNGKWNDGPCSYEKYFVCEEDTQAHGDDILTEQNSNSLKSKPSESASNSVSKYLVDSIRPISKGNNPPHYTKKTEIEYLKFQTFGWDQINRSFSN